MLKDFLNFVVFNVLFLLPSLVLRSDLRLLTTKFPLLGKFPISHSAVCNFFVFADIVKSAAGFYNIIKLILH